MPAENPLPSPNYEVDVTESFRCDVMPTTRVNRASLEVLRKVGALRSAKEPMLDCLLNEWWIPEILIESAYADLYDEMVVHLLVSAGKRLVVRVNSGSAVPFDSMGIVKAK